MGRVEDILAMDFAYLETFTERIDTDWGALFCNERQANYYDANHAHISSEVLDPDTVIDEVVTFYESKGIIPRFYIYNPEHQGRLLEALAHHHFLTEELISPVQLWDGHLKSMSLQPPTTTIERVDAHNVHEALHIECSITEFGGKETMEKVFMEQWNHPDYTHFLLRHEGIAVSTACLFAHGNQARLESLATLEAYRGKGFIGQLIRFVQHESSKQGLRKLWVFPINESVERIYGKYGFHTLDSLKSVHAFARGRSIRDIHASHS